MINKVRIKSREEIKEPRAENVKRRCSSWLGLQVERVEVIDSYLIDMELDSREVNEIREKLLMDPVSQQSVGLGSESFDWLIRVGFKPGVKDNEGERATKAIKELVGRKLEGDVYTSKEYLLSGDLTRKEAKTIAGELLANQLINRVEVKTKEEAIEEKESPPEVDPSSEPEVERFEPKLKILEQISERRNLALSEEDLEVIQSYFESASTTQERKQVGLTSRITDVELEAIAQTQSEHCKHKVFNGKIRYENKDSGKVETINSLFDSFIKQSTREIDPSWILSVFWDNAGVIEFNDDYAVSMKFETHNSPSGKEPYGGSITGIVGVYRDPMGTGMGSRIIAGSYGFCTPNPFYQGELDPEIKPRRLLEGIVEGVRDGGNKSGVPTVFGYSKYDNSFLGKPLVYVGAIGLLPKYINEKKSWKKDLKEGDLIVTVGGRVGRDGIHGVTESSMEFGEHITAGHVQIGDPFTQKKAHDFLMEARDEGLYKFVWDCGGGGLSSAVGETARFSNGCDVELDKVPLKYQGLDPWEVLISESQERMILGVDSEKFSTLEKLAERHDVEIANIGKYRDHGNFHVKWKGESVAYLDLDFLHEGFPRLELEAEWKPSRRGTTDPGPEAGHEKTLTGMLQRLNVASREWIQRQYDHEVQGSSVIKPLVGVNQDVDSDAAVIKPLGDSESGLAVASGNCFKYSKIDPYWMAACSLEEAIRRVMSVGATLNRIALNDNFCWPNSVYDPESNPEGKENLGGLVRANKALYKFTKAFGTPCISGKDSMYVDGNLQDENGEIHKVSGKPSLQFSSLGKVKDIGKCLDLSLKNEGDLVYLIGETKDHLGASEFYEMIDESVGRVPKFDSETALSVYRAVEKLVGEELLNSSRGCYRGGLAVSLVKKAIAGQLGLKVDLNKVSTSLGNDFKILYSETPSRFVVSLDPENKDSVEEILKRAGINYGKIGRVLAENKLVVDGVSSREIINLSLETLEKVWKSTFRNF